MSFEFDDSDFLRLLNDKVSDITKESIERMHDSVDDLARISVDIAPIDKTTLRRSVNKEVFQEGDKIIGEVSFSATEQDGKGRFNYALWTHEMDYELGEQSQASPGTDGYQTGNKYLQRPLEGESEKYLKWLAEGVVGGINK
ncbi:hypothetical protein V7138_14945 [Bacillus sp. JJ1533]|uniref:hypothetical protein n=1 Tax=Bacillus sp. JJ1533 TaxID=3122959 RepID=UPI002FFF066D